MALATIPGLFLTGNHASRPAATAVGSGALYACSTHGLIYQSDAATWSTWATLGGTETLPVTIIDAKGDLIAGTAADTAARLAAGSNDTILMAESAEATGLKWVASQTPTTQAYDDVAAQGSADTYARGDHLHGMPSAGGGSGTHSTLGTTSMGGSFRSPTSTTYLKKITIAADAFLMAIVAGIKGNNANAGGLGCAVFSDTAGAPVNVIAAGTAPGNQGSDAAVAANIQLNATARLIAMPVGVFLAAGDYWLAVHINEGGSGSTPLSIAYAAGSGSDKTQAHGIRSVDISIVGTSSTSDDHTIYADILTL
jgi:hypothetical protein